ncbi:HLA class II histocompatibility antigen, DQ beta 2 chain-like, partial [Emydura macquarii macquarii]|uniref:HLA class II histocompatibility antigen, DQ beta 2 chain-like n=1 Tax=Emydura macquarii macquarii TaxID=1129001 RepID=UPI00352A8EF0
MVKISPMKSGSRPHPHLLVCSGTGFYPSGIEIKWLKNRQEQPAGLVPTEMLQNTDWTFQILGMQEMTPAPRDVYTCQVEHISLRGPLLLGLTLPGARKMLAEVRGYVLGLVFMVLELLIYLNIKK